MVDNYIFIKTFATYVYSAFDFFIYDCCGHIQYIESWHLSIFIVYSYVSGAAASSIFADALNVFSCRRQTLSQRWGWEKHEERPCALYSREMPSDKETSEFSDAIARCCVDPAQHHQMVTQLCARAVGRPLPKSQCHECVCSQTISRGKQLTKQTDRVKFTYLSSIARDGCTPLQ